MRQGIQGSSPDEIQREMEKNSLSGRDARRLRGWLTVTMGIVSQLSSESFSLADVYSAEPGAGSLFPNNKHIKAS